MICFKSIISSLFAIGFDGDVNSIRALKVYPYGSERSKMALKN
jgi:hypothetical protein